MTAFGDPDVPRSPTVDQAASSPVESRRDELQTFPGLATSFR